MSFKNKYLLLTFPLVIFQLFFSLLFFSKPNLLIESKLTYYKQTAIMNDYKIPFVHSVIQSNGDFHIDSLSSFVRENTSRSNKSVIYYKLKEANNFKINLSANSGANYEILSSILYNPLRYDIGNPYFESFRVRQEFQDIDSRFIDSGFDFTIQLDSTIALELLDLNTISEDLSYFKNTKFKISLEFGDKTYQGYVSNIFYVEEAEPISTALNYFHGLYNIIVPTASMRSELESDVNFDFINNSLRIRNEMRKISKLGDYQVSFFDQQGENAFLSQIFGDLIEDKVDYLTLTIYTALAFLTLFFIVVSSNKLKIQKRGLGLIIILSIFIYQLILLIGKVWLNILFIYELSNVYYGAFSLFIFISITCILIANSYYRRGFNVN